MKKKTRMITGIVGLLIVAAVTVTGYRLYNKPHRSAATETAIALSAVQLAAEYETDEPASNKKFLGQAVQVHGTVSDMSVNQQKKMVVVLSGSAMSGVQCSMEENSALIKKGDMITIKGFCTGFLSDVILDRCLLVR